ncbi:flagellar filament capping protein FliD [Halarcobacter ebronensis]|uniref:Flagellar hook-associated protein 2 n=1 Tax=Halarcobacter ebronensis TaxID=1462615 RepID=A0A4V1M097_9BACT|nr:flagellar filament capping protein FliD [Halarcobacter ebronensis]QKF82080.1 flagellar filament cap protein FliD [Halarcobacter ebronensis]RXK04088.1 flagellar hook protein FliD [Halarcobacter ebronensis]
MAEGILGLGSSGSLELNDELIEKLKTAETTAYVDPIDDSIEKKEAELTASEKIADKIAELLTVVEGFDLYTSDTNVFDQVTASTTGTSASFDATDTSNLNPGTIVVNVTQLATKDVYQSSLISDPTSYIGAGKLTITVGEDSYTFDTTDEMTYEDLVTNLNYTSALDASLEKVSDNSYRLVIKSSESGLENAVTISQTDIDLGFGADESHIQTSQNFIGTIDGISYNMSSNKITMNNGLIITAVDEGKSSISISNDDSYITEQISKMATVYNELVDLVSSSTTADDDGNVLISDSSAIKSILSDIKNMFFDSYGLEDEENIFVYGISFDTSGYMQIDASELAEAVTNNYDDLKELFVGYAEKEGIGTKLSTYLDDLDSSSGTLTTFLNKVQSSIDDLNDNKEEEETRIDTKYQQLSEQFAAYTVIITQMENAFQSLKILMDSNNNDN